MMATENIFNIHKHFLRFQETTSAENANTVIIKTLSVRMNVSGRVHLSVKQIATFHFDVVFFKQNKMLIPVLFT
jgi:hypothetical protein